MRHAVLLLLTLLLLAPAAVAKDTAAEEAKLRAEVAELVRDHAEWCAGTGARDEGQRALGEARELAGDANAFADLAARLEELPGTDGEEPAPRKRPPLAPKVAKLYDRLAGLDHEPTDTARFEGYLLQALRWEPSKARVAKLRKAISSGSAEESGRMLVLARRAGVGAEFEDLELELARKGLMLLSSPDHLLVGWVSLPRGWSRSKTYPVLVGVEGAGSNFAGYAKGLVNSRGARDVIVLAPVTLSNTNKLDPAKYPHYPKEVLEKHADQGARLDFDGPGVDALLDVLRARFGAEEKVFLTGFSGGGLYTYWKLLHAPDEVAGAAPACANYSDWLARGAVKPSDAGPPVHLLTGEKDEHRDHVFGQKPGIEGQTDLVEAELARLGFANVQRTMCPGAGHSSLHREVWAFVDEVLAAPR